VSEALVRWNHFHLPDNEEARPVVYVPSISIGIRMRNQEISSVLAVPTCRGQGGERIVCSSESSTTNCPAQRGDATTMSLTKLKGRPCHFNLPAPHYHGPLIDCLFPKSTSSSRLASSTWPSLSISVSDLLDGGTVNFHY